MPSSYGTSSSTSNSAWFITDEQYNASITQNYDEEHYNVPGSVTYDPHQARDYIVQSIRDPFGLTIYAGYYLPDLNGLQSVSVDTDGAFYISNQYSPYSIRIDTDGVPYVSSSSS